MGALFLILSSLLGLTPPGQPPPNPAGWIADPNDKEWPAVPRDWETGAFAPGSMALLTLGTPNVLKQPQSPLALPFFQLPEMGLLTGDSAFLQELNNTIDTWQSNDKQRTFNAFLKLEENWKKLPPILPEVVLAKVMKGFFHTEMAVAKESTLKEGESEWTFLLHQRVAQGHFWDIVKTSDRVILLSPLPQSPLLYKAAHLTQWPVFKKGKEWEGAKKSAPFMAAKPLDVQLYLRSILPIALWNTFVLESSSKRWDRSFDGGDTLNDYLKANGLAEKQGPPTKTDPLTKFKDRLEIWPRTFADMGALVQVVQGLGHVENKDAASAVKSFHTGVLMATSPSLKSLGALMVGQVFSNLGDLRLAHRAYAWSESLAPPQHKILEDILFWGSELAFWQGRFSLAKQGFELFTQMFGNPQVSPWVRLRLAEMEHRSGNSNEALGAYETLSRTHSTHPAALEARVRAYCLDALNKSKKIRDNLWNSLEESLKSSRFSLQQQAKTCRMQSQLKETIEKTSTRPGSLTSRAQPQLELIEKFKAEFPDTPLSKQLETQKKVLSVAATTDLANKANCRPLMESYERHRNTLLELGNQGEKYVSGLTWGLPQKNTLGRCAALYGITSLWQDLRNQGTRFDSGHWQDIVFDLTTATQPETRYQKMFHQISLQPLERVMAAAKRFENPTELLQQPDFWFLFASYKLVSTKESEESSVPFQTYIKPWILNDFRRTLSNPLLCQWFLSFSSTLTSSEWDAIGKAFPTPVWLDWWKPGTTPTQCVETVVQSLFTVSTSTQPSPLRDNHIVEPFLKKQGPKAMSEEWLAFLQRFQQKRGPNNSKIRQWYAELEKETDNEAVRAAAKLWREQYVQPTQNMW